MELDFVGMPSGARRLGSGGGGAVSSVMNWLSDSRFHPVTPELPPEVLAVGRGMECGAPWPWEQVNDFADTATHDAVLCLEVPRSDHVTRLSIYLTHEPVPFDSFYPNARNHATSAHRGRTLDERRIRLGGTRAVVVTVSGSNHFWAWKLYGEYQGRLIEGTLTIPEAHAPGYIPHLNTIFGTWRWT